VTPARKGTDLLHPHAVDLADLPDEDVDQLAVGQLDHQSTWPVGQPETHHVGLHEADPRHLV
jgi:hypothetical protein